MKHFLSMPNCKISWFRKVSRIRKQGAACGVWIEEYQMAHVPQALSTGSWFQHIGFGGKSGYWLLPEETLLMVSSGRMDLLDENGLDIGGLGAWGACIEGAGGVNSFLVKTSFSRVVTIDLFSASTSRIHCVSTRVS